MIASTPEGSAKWISRAITAVVVASISCGGGAARSNPPPAKPAAKSSASYTELEARLPKLVTAMNQLAEDLAAVNDDCPKIAAVLRKWGSVYAIELDAMWELKTKLTPDELELFAHEHEDDADRLKPVFDAATSSCEGNEEVEEALTIAGFRRAESAR